MLSARVLHLLIVLPPCSSLLLILVDVAVHVRPTTTAALCCMRPETGLARPSTASQTIILEHGLTASNQDIHPERPSYLNLFHSKTIILELVTGFSVQVLILEAGFVQDHYH